MAAAARGQVFGMTMTLVGMEEVAGTGSSSHFCDVIVSFSGGSANSSNSSGSNYYEWRFFVSGGVQLVGGTGPLQRSIYYGSGASQTSDGFPVSNGTTLRLRLSASTTLSSSFKGLLSGHWYWSNLTTTPTTSANVYDDRVYDPFRLRRLSMDAVAVDSRKTYAPPNKDGSYPAVDANADRRSVAFAGWNHHGGLFIGNAAGVNGDQSGVSRVQCQATDPGGLPTCAYTISLLHLGTPAAFRAASTGWDGAVSLQAYVPAGSSSANLPIGSVTWETALDLAAATARGAALDLTSLPNDEYANVQLGVGSFPTRVLLTTTNESAPRWRYFGGSTYGTSPASYPSSEGQPHLWACDSPTAGSISGQSGAWDYMP